ncbi:tetratricopeptide repeat protein [Polyangium jinanense]|nr:tetratricopeptide repeat protein [Polyangium jinanense]
MMLVITAGGTARADDSAAEEAEALFREGKQLMAEKRYAEACSKFAESHRLDPGGGTILNLARCHEAEGKTATAYRELGEALAWARTDARPDRAEIAHERLEALEDKLARLVVVLGPGARAAGMVIERDGAPIAEASLGDPAPVDPGEHVVVATADGKEPFRTTVRVAPGARITVVVPALAPSRGPSGARIAAHVTAGLSAVALGAGAFFGIRALVKENEARAQCQGSVCPDAASFGVAEEGRTAARIANVTLGAGAICLVTSATLYWVSRSKSPSEPRASIAIAPSAGSGATLLLGGTF